MRRREHLSDGNVESGFRMHRTVVGLGQAETSGHSERTCSHLGARADAQVMLELSFRTSRAGSGGHFERGCNCVSVGIGILGGVRETGHKIILPFGHGVFVPGQAG